MYVTNSLTKQGSLVSNVLKFQNPTLSVHTSLNTRAVIRGICTTALPVLSAVGQATIT